MARNDAVEKAYEFLRQRAKDQRIFSKDELGRATGWQGKTPGTYLGKQLKSVVSKTGGGYRVKKHFIHLAKDDFVGRVSQTENILPSYSRFTYEAIINYEFLMPLSREGILRHNLDRLFFTDKLMELVKLIGGDAFEAVIPRRAGESESAYASRVTAQAARYFGGYSITHVNGRFRAGDVKTERDAVGERYIVDETTALVRFIIPLTSTKLAHRGEF